MGSFPEIQSQRFVVGGFVVCGLTVCPIRGKNSPMVNPQTKKLDLERWAPCPPGGFELILKGTFRLGQAMILGHEPLALKL